MRLCKQFKRIKMKNIFLILGLMTIALISSGQVLDKNEMYGKWEVEQIVERPNGAEYDELVAGFKVSSFSFDKEGNFQFMSKSNSEFVLMVVEMTKNTKWKVNDNFIEIGHVEDNYSIMKIIVRNNNDKMLFQLEESGILLQMKKVE